MSPVEMTVHADAIVVGTLGPTRNPRNDDQPHRFEPTRRFNVERVLKGQAFAAGDAIDVLQPWKSGPMHPSDDPVGVLLWLRVSADKKEIAPLQFTNSVKSPTPGLIKSVETALAVSAEPRKYLASDDPTEVEALCRVIGPAFFADKLPAEPADDALGISRQEAVQLLIRLVLKPEPHGQRTLATSLLAGFKSPAGFDALMAALSDKDSMCVAAAARGLRLLGDRRAAPAMIGVLQARTAHAADSEICRALAEFGDPASVPVLIDRLQQREFIGTIEALGALRDPRALGPLLESLWTDGYTLDAVLAYDDPSIVRQAWERAYTHQEAPKVLAIRGVAEAKPFMLKLIRQCDATGLQWARRTKDVDAVDATIEAMRHSDNSQFLIESISVVLDSKDPRATGSIARLLPYTGYGGYGFSALEKRLGLPQAPPAGVGPATPEAAADRRLRVHTAVLQAADRIDLDWRTRRWLEADLKSSEARTAGYGLPKWPTPDDPPALRAFCDIHRDTVRRLALDPLVPVPTRVTAIYTITMPAAGPATFGRDDLHQILMDPNWSVQQAGLEACQRLNAIPTTDEVRQMRGSPALKYWLYQVAQNTRWARSEVLQELIEADDLATNRELHAALRAVKLKSAIPRLAELLEQNAIGVRVPAAVTLAHLADSRGRPVLEDAQKRYQNQKYNVTVEASEVDAALRQLDLAR